MITVNKSGINFRRTVLVLTSLIACFASFHAAAAGKIVRIDSVVHTWDGGRNQAGKVIVSNLDTFKALRCMSPENARWTGLGAKYNANGDVDFDLVTRQGNTFPLGAFVLGCDIDGNRTADLLQYCGTNCTVRFGQSCMYVTGHFWDTDVFNNDGKVPVVCEVVPSKGTKPPA